MAENETTSKKLTEVDESTTMTDTDKIVGNIGSAVKQITLANFVKMLKEKIRLSDYQTKTDENLTTENKDIVGAINENKDSINKLSDEIVNLTVGMDMSSLTMKVTSVENGNRLTLSDGTTEKHVDIPAVSVTNEQLTTIINTWLDEHPEEITTVADGSITPTKTDFLKHVKAGEEWIHTLVGEGYLAVATGEYLDIQGLEKLIVLVTDGNWNTNVCIACYDESQTQLQTFTKVNTNDNQRVIDVITGENTGSVIYTTKTTIDLLNAVVENTRYIKVKVEQYKSTTDSNVKIYTSEYYNGENYIEWSEKYENQLVKDNSIKLKHTDFITYNNPNLIDVTNFKSTGIPSDSTDLTQPGVQFGKNQQPYFYDYIDVREKKSIYVRTVRNKSVTIYPYIVACYDEEKNFISNELATDTFVRSIGGPTTTHIMDDGYEVVGATITVHRIDVPSEVSFIRLCVVLASNVNWVDVKYILVSHEDILNLTAIAETYEKIVSSEWKEAINKCFDGKEIYTGVFIGDSLTNWGGGGDTSDSGFLKIVHDKTGVVTKNEGYAGATWQNVDGQTACGVQRIDTLISENRKYDLYCFLLGTNGGSTTDTGETSADTSTMCGAIRYCMEKLKEYDPTSKILVCLPPQREEGNDSQEKVNEVIKTIVNSYGVKTLDIYHESGIVPNTKIADIGYLSDGLHLGDKGIQMLGDLLASEVKYILCL